MQTQIVAAIPSDHFRLSEIAFAAKAYWAYPPELLEQWKPNLTIAPAYIRQNQLFKVINAETQILGFVALEKATPNLHLEHCWVDPTYIGQGLGRALLTKVFEVASAQSALKVTVVSDPYATTFYEKFGFIKTGEIESTPKGRFLPEMEKIL
ncbi:MAG: GNAT family N-acetyltransferase [Saprospiraceae bacterium]